VNPSAHALELLLSSFAFVLGAVVGSFLNVCIHRLPRDLSVSEPRRSFCPACKSPIPWHRNLPILSWLWLRGRCADCAARIPFRYLLVEVLTGLLFWALWQKYHSGVWVLVLPAWVFASLLIAATFIDFEHYIIPDSITLGGAAAGLILSAAIPQMMDSDDHLASGLWSLLGAASGYGLVWAVVELGKLALGRKRIAFEQPEPFRWTLHGDDADLQVAHIQERWSEIFARPSDRLIVEADTAEVEGHSFTSARLVFEYEFLQIGSERWHLDKVPTITGTLRSLTIPREAMGFGDVKFAATIGAFLGWKAVLFTFIAACCTGACIGLLTIALGRREWSAKIPFGPYLAFAALLWVFAGPELLEMLWRWRFGDSFPN